MLRLLNDLEKVENHERWKVSAWNSLEIIQYRRHDGVQNLPEQASGKAKY